VTWGKRKRRVRLHLIDPPTETLIPGTGLPSIEGVLLSSRPDYEIAQPRLITNPDTKPVELESRIVVVPRERVAFYEVIA
jgi:hypothetical protein